MKTFAQGIHPEYWKERTAGLAIVEAALPRSVTIPLHQHTGASCEPLVKVGDQVVEGQKIGDTSKFISAPVHASISGTVKKIEPLPHPCGMEILSVVIEAGEGPGIQQPVAGSQGITDLTPEAIRKAVREAGIVGLGGAAFPTHVKLTPPEGKKIDTLLVNGCECEPFITADHRLMLEQTKELISGAQVAAKAVGAARIIIGVEDNKADAIDKLKSEIRDPKSERKSKSEIQIVELETKYPQGGEKMLIKAALGREVPTRGLPLDVGVVVINVGTAAAIDAAVRQGTPLTSRVVTVTGPGVRQPKNFRVKLGVSFRELLGQSGGLTAQAYQVIMGGPMMGVAQSSLDVPVVKATSCLLVLNQEEAKREKIYPCVKCARCVSNCPMFLVPSRLAAFAENGRYGEFEEWGGEDCLECGCCAFVCPARIPIVHWIKLAKYKLRRMK